MRIFGAVALILFSLSLGCINGNINSYNNGSWTNGVNLETPLEMVDYGLQSNTGAISFYRTSTILDTSDYDGYVSYSFEINAQNSSVGVPYSVYLIDSMDNIKATLSVPANTLNPTRFRAAFAANNGYDVYRVKLDPTTASQELKVHLARMLVNQVGATRTRIYIPLIGSSYNAYSSNDTIVGFVYSTTSTTHTMLPVANNAWWIKNSSNYSNINSWGFEATLKTNNAAGPAYAALYNRTGGVVVTASEVSTTSTANAQVVSTAFPGNAVNFIDFNGFGVSLKATSTYTAYLYRAGIWVKLDNMSYGEVYNRISKNITSVSSAVGEGRVKFDSSLFSNPKVYFETTVAANTSPINLWDVGVTDVGTSGSSVVASTVNVASPPNSMRSGQLSLTNGNSYLAAPSNTSLIIVNPSIVVKFNR